MKRSIFILFILLTTSFTQSFGQPPAGAVLLQREDFGGNLTTDPAVRPTNPFPAGTTTLQFYPNAQAQNNGFNIAKHITAAMAYPVWFSATNPPDFDDHTYPGDMTRGYMMVINAPVSSARSQFFQYTIHNLCANTHLYFSIWAGNLVNASHNTANADPSLTLILVDAGNPLDTLNTFNTGTIPKSNTATGPVWHQYGIDFLNHNSDSITFIINNNVFNGSGNDLVMDDIEVWLSTPQLNVSGPKYYCPDANMNLSASYTDPLGTFGANPEVEWFYSPDINAKLSTWQKLTIGNSYKGKVQAGYFWAVAGAAVNIAADDYRCCSVSDAIEVRLITQDTLYWSKSPVDQDWNNPANWEFADGTPSPYAPSTCCDVHIPGNASKYPSLDPLAQSACNDIWFHFGAVVAKPHLLDYHCAYVQYNFGYNNGVNGDPYSATNMNRGQWYALAAPLQKIVSGDFALGGYPHMWQKSFKTHQTGGYGTLDDNGEWYTPENNLIWDIGKQYNAIAIWAGDYAELGIGEGSLYQTNLNGLHGILEMPYFENDDAIQFHRGFSHINGVSYFKYMNHDLTFTGDSVGFARDSAAYRFIFESDPFTKSIDAGKAVFSMPVSQTDEIMVGNPFISHLDFNAFAANNGLDQYRLYINSNFVAYDKNAGSPIDMKYIAPLQAFFIRPVAPELKFYADDVSTTDPDDIKLRSSNMGDMRADVLYINAKSNAGESWLSLSMQNVNKNNLILLLPQGYPEIPQIYAVDRAGQRNSIQFEGQYVKEVPLGILSTVNDKVTLTFHNQEQLTVSSLILWDKHLDTKTDLQTMDSYTFQNVPGVQDRFLLMMEKKTVTGIPSPEVVDHPVYVNLSGNTLSVNAVAGIEDISVISLQGITVAKENNRGQTSYTKMLNLPSGLYLVSIRLTTGETKVAKIRK